MRKGHDRQKKKKKRGSYTNARYKPVRRRRAGVAQAPCHAALHSVLFDTPLKNGNEDREIKVR